MVVGDDEGVGRYERSSAAAQRNDRPHRLSGKIGGAPDGPIARILERTLLVEDLGQAFRLHATNPAFAYVTPQGDIVRLDGSATGGDGRALQHWLLQRRAEKEEIARRMSETAAALEETEGTFVRLP